jgi:hypothetical protein
MLFIVLLISYYPLVTSKRKSKKRITIIDIESQNVMTTIPMHTFISGMAVRGRTIYYCAVTGKYHSTIRK